MGKYQWNSYNGSYKALKPVKVNIGILLEIVIEKQELKDRNQSAHVKIKAFKKLIPNKSLKREWRQQLKLKRNKTKT